MGFAGGLMGLALIMLLCGWITPTLAHTMLACDCTAPKLQGVINMNFSVDAMTYKRKYAVSPGHRTAAPQGSVSFLWSQSMLIWILHNPVKHRRTIILTQFRQRSQIRTW